MSTIRTRKNKDGSVSHQAIVRVKDHQSHYETFAKKKEAQDWADAMTVALRASPAKIANPSKFNATTLSKAIDDYSAWSEAAQSLVRVLKTVRREIGPVSLRQIDKEFMEGYIKKMIAKPSQYGRPYTKATLAKHITAIRVAIKHQASIHRVEAPLTDIKSALLGKGWDTHRDRLMSSHEENAIRAEFMNRVQAEHWDLLFDLALETGARQSEMILATTSEFSMSERVWIIPIHHAKARYPRQVPLSKKATRAAQRLLELLELHNKALLSSDPQALPETRLFWVFATPSSVCTNFKKITTKLDIKDLHFHDLRHTAITHMVLHRRKLSIFEIMKIVGHKSIEMLNRYANLRGGELVERME